MKYYINLFLAFLKKFKLTIFVAIVIGLIFSYLLKFFLVTFLFNNKQVIGLTGRYTVEDLPIEILEKISLGLTKFDGSNIPVPAVASSWETTDNGKTWVFKINKNLYWQNGEKLNSQNINLNLSGISLKRPDEETLVFELENAYSPFPSIMTKPIFYQGLLGNGEWKVKNLNFSGGIVQSLEISNNSNTTIYKFYPTNERTKLAFKLGEVDQIINLLDSKPFDSWKTVSIKEEFNENQVVVIFFNTKDKALSEKNLRQALAYAIDKEPLGRRAINPISPNSWAYNPQVKDYSYNIERAKELMSELPKELSDISINLVTSPVLLSTADKISKDWEKLGLKTQILVSSIIPTDFQAYLTILDIPRDPDQYTLWHSTQTSSNISKYSNARIDKLLEEGRTIVNIEERKKIYFDLQRFLLEDLPAIFLYYPKYYHISRE